MIYRITCRGGIDVDEFRNIQKLIFENKLKKGFNISNVELEFCYTHGELAEEVADVVIYLYGIAEILGYDLNEEIMKKVKKNKERIYKEIDGINTRISGD